MEKTILQQSKRQSGINPSKTLDIWSVQCGECFKWRLISTEEEYEEIRSKFIENPFVCTKKMGVSCDDPTDIEYDNSRTWAIDKPNIPKTPAGFKRTVVMRKDWSKMDCYYDAPNGKRLRASTEVAKFLDKHPEYKKGISLDDFSFNCPKIMKDTCPDNDAAKD
ncbi:hypothetical protein DH2020_046150 [Rehmannia glutinosa]|uniref:Methyl-CpG-binding domain-containing protein n=1 Tax=Rehmannia glutinosa TaxID=99300 RepID=A0ABR0UC60_REHGL